MQKLIPPLLLVIFVLIMTLIHFIFPYKIVIFSPFNYVGILFIILGLTIARKINSNFSKVNTEIHTFKKPRKLLTNGLFQYSRNPIYVGFILTLIGLNILLGSVTPFLIVLVFIFVTNYWYIRIEEKNMQEQFGQEYTNYKKKVRRWI